MVLILSSVIFAASVVAISIIRHQISFGRFTGDGIAKEDIAIAKEGAERSRITDPIKQKFSIAVLPDGKALTQGSGSQFEPSVLLTVKSTVLRNADVSPSEIFIRSRRFGHTFQ